MSLVTDFDTRTDEQKWQQFEKELDAYRQAIAEWENHGKYMLKSDLRRIDMQHEVTTAREELLKTYRSDCNKQK